MSRVKCIYRYSHSHAYICKLQHVSFIYTRTKIVTSRVTKNWDEKNTRTKQKNNKKSLHKLKENSEHKTKRRTRREKTVFLVFECNGIRWSSQDRALHEERRWKKRDKKNKLNNNIGAMRKKTAPMVAIDLRFNRKTLRLTAHLNPMHRLCVLFLPPSSSSSSFSFGFFIWFFNFYFTAAH